MFAAIFAARLRVLPLVILAVLALPALAAPAIFAFNGYVQGRFSETIGAPTPDSFEAKRAYVALRATIDPNYSAYLLVSGFNTVSVLEAYAEYTDAPFSARLGLSRVPFGYEIPLSSSRLITLERSEVIQDLVYPYTFDRGVFAYYQPKSGFTGALALTNGEPVGIPRDDEENKTLIARLGHAIPGGQLGASIYNGREPGAGVTADLELVGVDAQWASGPFTVLSEYVTGSRGTADPNGGYLTVAYRQADSRLQPYLRYDSYDRDSNLPNRDFTRYTTGVNYFPNPATRLTLEYETFDDDLNAALEGRITAQAQVSF